MCSSHVQTNLYIDTRVVSQSKQCSFLNAKIWSCYYYLYHWETLSILCFARQRPRCIPLGSEAKPAHVEHCLEKRMIIRKKRTLRLELSYYLLEANRHNGKNDSQTFDNINFFKIKKVFFVTLKCVFLIYPSFVVNRNIPLCMFKFIFPVDFITNIAGA